MPVTAVGPEIVVVPDVLANRQRDLPAVELGGTIFRGRLEIAVLIKDIVGRQQRFRAGGDDPAVLKERGGIGDLAAGAEGVLADVTDEQTDGAGGGGEAVQRFEILRDELFLEEQIAGRIAGDAEFGADDHVSAGVDAAAVRGEDSGLVAGEVADGGVQLGQGDFHARRGQRGRKVSISEPRSVRMTMPVRTLCRSNQSREVSSAKRIWSDWETTELVLCGSSG